MAPHVPGFHDDRAYVSGLFDRLGSSYGLTLAAFKRRLWEAHKAGLIRLSRADLVQAMNADHVRRSAIGALNGGDVDERELTGAPVWHLVATAGRAPTAEDGPRRTSIPPKRSSMPPPRRSSVAPHPDDAFSAGDGKINALTFHESTTRADFDHMFAGSDAQLAKALHLRTPEAIAAARQFAADIDKEPPRPQGWGQGAGAHSPPAAPTKLARVRRSSTSTALKRRMQARAAFDAWGSRVHAPRDRADAWDKLPEYVRGWWEKVAEEKPKDARGVFNVINRSSGGHDRWDEIAEHAKVAYGLAADALHRANKRPKRAPTPRRSKPPAAAIGQGGLAAKAAAGGEKLLKLKSQGRGPYYVYYEDGRGDRNQVARRQTHWNAKAAAATLAKKYHQGEIYGWFRVGTEGNWTDVHVTRTNPNEPRFWIGR